MDNVTHTLTGLAMSRAGLNRYYKHATPLLLLAANAPDIDIASAVGGGFNYFRYHRAFTHSLVAAPLLALVLALLFCAFERSLRNLAVTFGIALAGVASHLLLDWTNSYGVRYLFPFNAHWYSLDWTNVFDVWIWAILILAALGPLLARLVNAEVGARARSAPGRGLAIFALLFLTLYNVGRGVIHQRALATLESRVYEGASPIRAGAFPTPANPFQWDGVVETGATVRHYHFSLLDSFDPDSGEVFQKPENSAAVQTAARTSEFATFLAFSKYPLWTVVPVSEPENSVRVRVRDMRFGFFVETVVDSAGHAATPRFQFR